MINAAIVGLGWWGKNIVQCLNGSDKIKITHGFDVDLSGLSDFADANGLSLADSYEDLLSLPEIDAVILATPHALHESQVLAATEAEKQIFCEKPLALSAEAAKGMLARCREKNIVLGIGHERRFEGALEEMKSRLDSGELGTLIHLECNWSHNNFAATPAAGWRQDPKQAPAGTLTALGVHITDYFQSLGGPVETLFAQMAHRSEKFPSDDVLTVQFQFESGATGTMTNIATTPFYCRINVFGDQGWAEAREVSNVDIPDPAEFSMRDSNDEVTNLSFEATNTVRANFHSWADAVEGRSEYRFSEDEKLHNVEILDAILRSIRSGQPEKVRI